jgi:RNA polymerase sigma-70 factor (ECF subfamily)
MNNSRTVEEARAMELNPLTYHGTGTAAGDTPIAVKLLDPETTPGKADRDWQLIEALRLREATAAERLVSTYGDRAYRLAIRILGSAHDAEEAVQDAFCSVVRKIDTFRGDSSLRSWIYRIVANAAHSKVRGGAHRRHEISLDEVLPIFHEDGRHAGHISDWSASVDDPAVQTELRAALESAIAELPAHYRAVVVLRHVEDVSMAEVAASLGITIETAKSRAHRARLFLRQRLADFMSGATSGAEMGSKDDEILLRLWPR